MLVIDVQGFDTLSGYIPKEMAITNGEVTEHYIFKPPYPFRHLEEKFKKQVRWLERFYHGLRWNAGYVDLNEVPSILKRTTLYENTIYCKGEAKAEFLTKYLDGAVRVVDLGPECDFSIRKQGGCKPLCFSHTLKDNCHCSLAIAGMLYHFVTNNKV